ncbi:MAG: DUF6370 family protein [Chitinophagaceae bacterium]|nr:hypothetical protein [Chitinophagaceae bacterium]
MKILIAITFVVFLGCTSYAQNTGIKTAKPDPTKKIETVEASCGQCQFHLTGKGCSLAIRIDGKAYFVDGTTIDEHGDAHATDGFCEAIRKAEIQGELVKDRYKITYFKLVKIAPKEDEKKM